MWNVFRVDILNNKGKVPTTYSAPHEPLNSLDSFPVEALNSLDSFPVDKSYSGYSLEDIVWNL